MNVRGPCESLSGKQVSSYSLRQEGVFTEKRTSNLFFLRHGILLFLLLFLSGCITDATTDLTKAPFEAITALTDGTTQATTELTEPTREFLSSTTPGAWINSDGTLNPAYERIAFVVLNFDNLQGDMAQGGGEYLESLSQLLSLSLDARRQFVHSAQSHYGHFFEEGYSREESLRRLIQTFPRLAAPNS